MKKPMKTIWSAIWRFAPLVICVICMFVYLFSGQDLTAESLLNFAPEEPFLAALFLILLYAFKSLTIFFPITVLNILGGFLFEPMHALIVNAVGVLVELTVPYWIGRASGVRFADTILTKYSKLQGVLEKGTDNRFFTAFFLRVIACLPGDAISMLFGARKMPFGICLVGSFLGTLPSMVVTTLLGTSITDPTSVMFWVSIGLTVLFSVISLLIYRLWQKNKKNDT